MLKTLIRKPVGVFILSWLLAAIVALTMVTIRWRTYNPKERQEILDDHDGFILVFWHSRIIAMPWLWPRRHAMNALQSPHPDGRLGRGKRPVPDQKEHMFRKPLIYKNFAILAHYIHVIIELGLDKTSAEGLFFSKPGQPFLFNLRDWRICRANKEFGWRADGFGVGLNAFIC